MNVEYINPFIAASRSVISQTTGFDPAIGQLYVKATPYTGDKVMIIIGLAGKIRGNVVVSFDYETAYKIVSAMMGGMPIQTLDEMSKSAIAELCNMILGNTATIFSKKNIHVDITPPTVLTGDNMQLSAAKSTVVCIPLILDDNAKIELDISYIEN
ncbi:chemotaxis protein CheX [Lutispora saccharofermentans]|uniref:Chemotaxis protein CheX n=1 Tax=Lutispora saccharofermentans TaxID=3024236 RepID=A0ABT1NKI6_9FIRM|nr:chemotaxis protein CheX [Lutispora saccharofermentans]MCQ1530643.1 chemotaxis protein CheX [Lutispora saccharofermentans]